jgi:hypothetical protein
MVEAEISDRQGIATGREGVTGTEALAKSRMYLETKKVIIIFLNFERRMGGHIVERSGPNKLSTG